jgi:8-hydroxy-5-deazaflavin:NADPH oxidoreductase
MSTKKIGIIGSGVVGQSLTAGFAHYGYAVMIGSRTPDKLKEWRDKTNEKIELGNFTDAAEFGDIIVLAVKGAATKDAVEIAGVDYFSDKIVIDTANPILDAPPENGVLKFFTTLDNSLMEELQVCYPSAKFVKAFSCIGAPFMVNPQFETKPTMFICGNDDNAKKEVTEILDKFGFETEDMGGVEAARAIEPLCILWCIPGFRQNSWSHAFKLLKM